MPYRSEIEIALSIGPALAVRLEPLTGDVLRYQRYAYDSRDRCKILIMCKDLLGCQIKALAHAFFRMLEHKDERLSSIVDKNRLNTRVAGAGNDDRPSPAHPVDEQ